MGRWSLLPALVALSICVGCSQSSAPDMEKMVDTYMEGLVGCPVRGLFSIRFSDSPLWSF